jgi:hypothetical protein
LTFASLFFLFQSCSVILNFDIEPIECAKRNCDQLGEDIYSQNKPSSFNHLKPELFLPALSTTLIWKKGVIGGEELRLLLGGYIDFNI